MTILPSDWNYHEGPDKWDRRFLDLAKFVAQWSKDPSTKTGAVIVDYNNRIVSIGYNGLPKGIEDSSDRLEDRQLKYELIIHCEENAILFAQRSLEGCVLYTWPFLSCSRCAGKVIQVGIKRCVAPMLPEHLKERWGNNIQLTQELFREAKVMVAYYMEDTDG